MIETNSTAPVATGKPLHHSRSVSPQPRIITSKPSVVEEQMSPSPRKLVFNNSKGTKIQLVLSIRYAKNGILLTEEGIKRKTSPLATTSTPPTLPNSTSPKIVKSDSLADAASEPKTPPAGGLMRLLQPLKNTLSVSADNIPIRPLSVAKIMGRRPSKCQSIDWNKLFYSLPNLAKRVVARGGIEPATFALLARRSNQLS